MRLTQEKIYNSVCECMARDKAFLDPSISLIALSKMLSINTSYLSHAINRCAGCNFRGFINDLRIAYAVKLIESTGHVSSVAGLMVRCGYESASVFHSAFKQRTGLSPIQYVRATARSGSRSFPFRFRSKGCSLEGHTEITAAKATRA